VRQKRDWPDIFARQEASGLSINAFCKQEGLHSSAFSAARKKHNAAPPPEEPCDIVRIIEEEYRPRSFGGEPLPLLDFQKRILREMFSIREDGRLKYQTMVYSTPKKCLAPGTKVLRGDLRWVPVETLQQGEKIIAFDEHAPKRDSRGAMIKKLAKRRLRMGRVVSTGVEEMECVELRLSDGRVLICQNEHPWLTTKRGGGNFCWREAAQFRAGDNLLQFLPMWIEENTHDAGYIGGVFDGEGHVRPDGREMGFAQKENVLWRKAVEILRKGKIDFHVYDQRGVYKGHDYSINKLSVKNRKNTFIALGRYRPERLIDLVLKGIEEEQGGYLHRVDTLQVTSVRPIGMHPVVTLETSTGTYFAEGFAAHNSGKTELASAVTYAWARIYGGEIYSISNDLEGAKNRMFSRVVEAMKMLREHDPIRFHQVMPDDKRQRERIALSGIVEFADAGQLNFGPHQLRYIASDYAGEAGAMNALVVFDELWAVSTERGERLWTEMQPIPNLKASARFVTTYAGFYGESALLWRIYESVVKPDPHTGEEHGTKIPGLEDLPVYVSDDGSTIAYWDHEARMPWHTPEFLEQARNDPSVQGRESEYRRLWQNEWSSGVEAFIEMDAVDRAIEKGKRRNLRNNLDPALLGI
jgi:hypothetical protein